MFTPTYSKKLKKSYSEACQKNETSEDVYFCATQNRVTKRNLELDKNYVFCEKETNRGDRPEYRLQAYLIKQAKKNKWHLQIKDEKGEKVDWILLDAERNFAKAKSPRKFDLLAYSPKMNAYIILELKKDRLAFPKAENELHKYIKLLKENISGANIVYGKNVLVDSVYGYIVAPEGNPKQKTKYKPSKYNVILFNFTDPKNKDAQKALFIQGSPKFVINKGKIKFI